MTLTDAAIKRPVFATVISLLIVIAGLWSLGRLPVRELPKVDSALVTVAVAYPGAAPEIIDTEIVELVEGAVSGIDGILSISSNSRLGTGRTVIEFTSGRDIDQAANDVRDAVGRILGRLPEEAEAPLVLKTDSDAQPVMRISITSDRLTPPEISDYASRYIIDRLSVLEGVAQIEIFGERSFAVRIWLDRQALAARQLAVADIDNALRRNNLELPAGEVRSLDRQFTLRTDTRLRSVEEFRAMTVAMIEGHPVRLGDVAEVEMGVVDDRSLVRANGQAAVGLGVLRQSQANTISVSDLVRGQLETLRPNLPEGMTISVSSDDAIYIRQSIREVVIALGFSVALVVAVILVFLHSARATLVPAITIPVAVIGTFTIMLVLGFSLNVLTLLALLLAVGLVVDDAIVVLENIQRRIEAGEGPLAAALLGARQVVFAVIATSVTLVAVFLPIAALEGRIGRLFAEFGLVLAAAVAISTFVALTLCVMLCSKLLRGRDAHRPMGPVGRGLERGLAAIASAYCALLNRALARPGLVVVLAALLSLSGLGLYQILPKELTPAEDRGVFFIPIVAPQGSTATYTDRNARQIEAVANSLLESGEATRVFSIVGFRNQPERGFVVVGLSDWSDRERSQQEIVRRLTPEFAQVVGVRAFPVNPAGLGQGGSSQPLRVVVGGTDHEIIKGWADAIVARAETNPGLTNVSSDFEPTRPQLNVVIDRRRADDLGISIDQIGQTLQTMMASREVTDFVDRGRVYPVMIQARAEDRRTPSDLAGIHVRAGDGRLVPLSAVVTLDELASAPELRRYDRLPSITVSAGLADGYALGEAIQYMEGIAAEILPPEARVSFAGQSLEFQRTSGGLMMVFALALVVVFLVLAAQFESWVHPLIIMLTVPLGVAGALGALAVTGLSLNVYSQIGIILLIGLMAKNGILIVEFANQLRAQGHDVRSAVTEAARLRFRPIVMTVLSTMLGALPLVFAAGAGAESRFAVGVVIVGGLGLASALTLFVTPVLYDRIARFARPVNAVAGDLDDQLKASDAAGRIH